MYNVNAKHSFKYLNDYLSDIEKYYSKNTTKILIESKCDEEERRNVSYQEGKNFSIQNEMKFFEISVKTNYSIKESFEALYKQIILSKQNNDKEYQ